MTKIILTKENLMTPTEFKAVLEQTTTRPAPLEDVLGLLRELVAYENEFDMTSDVFYARFMRGEMGDAMSFIMWAGQYEAYLEAKQEITSQLRETAVAI